MRLLKILWNWLIHLKVTGFFVNYYQMMLLSFSQKHPSWHPAQLSPICPSVCYPPSLWPCEPPVPWAPRWLVEVVYPQWKSSPVAPVLFVHNSVLQVELCETGVIWRFLLNTFLSFSKWYLNYHYTCVLQIQAKTDLIYKHLCYSFIH